MARLTVMAFNVATGSTVHRGGPPNPFIDPTAMRHVDFIRAKAPDIVALQEVWENSVFPGAFGGTGVQQFTNLVHGTGMHGVFSGVPNNNVGGKTGTALLSKFPIRSVARQEATLDGQLYVQEAFEVIFNSRAVRLFSVHWPGYDGNRPDGFDNQIAAADMISSMLPPRGAAIALGDYNAGLNEISMRRLLSNMVDLERAPSTVKERECMEPCGSNFEGHFKTDEIDHILFTTWGVTPVRCIRLNACHAGKRLSDHTIVLGEFEVAPPGQTELECESLKARIKQLQLEIQKLSHFPVPAGMHPSRLADQLMQKLYKTKIEERQSEIARAEQRRRALDCWHD